MSKRNRRYEVSEGQEGILEEAQEMLASGEELTDEHMEVLVDSGMDIEMVGDAAVMSTTINPEDVIEAVKSGLDINTLVQPGKKGVTNAQMIPSMKLAIDNEDTQALDLLKQYYPSVFFSSTKYLGKDRIIKLESLGY